MTAQASALLHSLRTTDVNIYYGKRHAVGDVSIDFKPASVTALMGPSGCGKTTLLRALNRLHETVAGARVDGTILLDGEDIYDMGSVALRRRVGMVFQRPNPFPTLSIYKNVVAGLESRDRRRNGPEIAERALKSAALWDQVKDRLDRPAVSLSGGQQQRLCIARALAVEPEVLLMDEPTSSLDPIATSSVEDLITDLGRTYTIIIVTHNMQQAARVSDETAFMLADADGVGRLVEMGNTTQIFTNPRDKRTEDYITGRFG